MSIRELVSLMERHLPCLPDPLPTPDSEADYLWRATLFNAGRAKPLDVVKLMPRIQVIDDRGNSVYVRVRCDRTGRGVQVL